MKPDILVANPFAPDIMAAMGEQFTLHRYWEAMERYTYLRKRGWLRCPTRANCFGIYHCKARQWGRRR